MKPTYIIGIDNGLTGGVCLLSPKGKIVDLSTIFTVKYDKKNEISPMHLYDRLKSMLGFCESGAVVFIEKPVGAKSANAMRSMAASFSTIYAVCELVQYTQGTITRINRVAARTWQKALLPKGVDTKVAAVAKAKQLWPDEDFLATTRSKVPHLGLVDAALIAYHGQLTL